MLFEVCIDCLLIGLGVLPGVDFLVRDFVWLWFCVEGCFEVWCWFEGLVLVLGGCWFCVCCWFACDGGSCLLLVLGLGFGFGLSDCGEGWCKTGLALRCLGFWVLLLCLALRFLLWVFGGT